jgi:hypothetical protein
VYLVTHHTDRNLVFRSTLTADKHKRNRSEWSTLTANNDGEMPALVQETPSSAVIL